MINPIESLAFSIHANKGCYALLLGSGISRAAGIPTGWEITEELIRKLAAQRNEICENLEKWYFNEFGTEPTYSKILEELSGNTREARQKIIQEFFTEINELGEKVLKQPTKAHKAIARLIKSGYIQVVVTTNFDRLLEQALESEGSLPATVLSTTEQVIGSEPLQHIDSLILKVHGDWSCPHLVESWKGMVFGICLQTRQGFGSPV